MKDEGQDRTQGLNTEAPQGTSTGPVPKKLASGTQETPIKFKTECRGCGKEMEATNGPGIYYCSYECYCWD